jgi:hypothetical protein
LANVPITKSGFYAVAGIHNKLTKDKTAATLSLLLIPVNEQGCSTVSPAPGDYVIACGIEADFFTDQG